MTETKPKPRQTYSSTNLRTPICTVMLACDGENLNMASRKRGFCGKCLEAARRRGKVLPVKGQE